MKKNEFLQFFNFDDKVLLSSLYEKLLLSEKTNNCVFSSEFLTPNVWMILMENQNKFGVKIEVNGLFSNSERRIVSFNRNNQAYPIKFIKIRIKNKFQKINHKDALGSLMSIGVKRDKFGDLVLKDDFLYFPICEDVLKYVEGSFFKIKNLNIKIEIVEEPSEIPEADFEVFQIIATNMRLDSIVSSIIKVSRTKIVDFISSGEVLVNYSSCSSKNKEIFIGDLITIRGYGKYIIDEVSSKTQSDRLRINMKKFI